MSGKTEELPKDAHVWEFALEDSATRHRVEFKHNTFTGKRLLKLDGREIHKVSAKYKLTGLIKFKINEHLVSLSIDPARTGGLAYTLKLDEKIVPDVTSALSNANKCEKWQVACKDGKTRQVAFDKDSFEVYVDSYAVDAAADFVDVGSAYLFSMPSGEEGKITVRPTKRTDRPIVQLYINGSEQENAPAKRKK